MRFFFFFDKNKEGKNYKGMGDKGTQYITAFPMDQS